MIHICHILMHNNIIVATLPKNVCCIHGVSVCQISTYRQSDVFGMIIATIERRCGKNLRPLSVFRDQV